MKRKSGLAQTTAPAEHAGDAALRCRIGALGISLDRFRSASTRLGLALGRFRSRLRLLGSSLALVDHVEASDAMFNQRDFTSRLTIHRQI